MSALGEYLATGSILTIGALSYAAFSYRIKPKLRERRIRRAIEHHNPPFKDGQLYFDFMGDYAKYL